MKKPTLCVIFGGKSNEYEVSLRSAYAVLCHLDKEKYDVLCLGITKKGEWYLYDGGKEGILEDRWQEGSLSPVALDLTHGNLVVLGKEIYALEIDLFLPVLHGGYGEDGRLQGLFDVAGLKYVGCGAYASHLCMDKYLTKQIAKNAGVPVAKGVKVNAKYTMQNAKSTQGVAVGTGVLDGPLANGSFIGAHCPKILHCVQNDKSNIAGERFALSSNAELTTLPSPKGDTSPCTGEAVEVNAKPTQGVTVGTGVLDGPLANGSFIGAHCPKILHCVQNDKSNIAGERFVLSLNAKLTIPPSRDCDTFIAPKEATPHPSATPTPSPQGEGLENAKYTMQNAKLSPNAEVKPKNAKLPHGGEADCRVRACSHCYEAEEISYPVFVKPTTGGSSIGVTMVENALDLDRAIGVALEHGDVLIEELVDGQEVEVGVLEKDGEITVSPVGMVKHGGRFYDYETKYRCESNEYLIPAPIDMAVAEKIQGYARHLFCALGCRGFGRFDFFVKKNGEVVFNEVNTLPGLTDVSMFPKLFTSMGYSFGELVDMIVAGGV